MINKQDMTEIGDLEAFGREFSEFKSNAFRFEYIQDFKVPEEQELLKKYMDGDPAPDDLHLEWKRMLEAGIQKGASVQRVRMLKKPISTYVKFEMSYGYSKTMTYGEKIYFLSHENCLDLPIQRDFWIFDDTRIYDMKYSSEGKFMGVVKIAGDGIDFVKTKSMLLRRAVKLTQKHIEEFAK